MGLNEPAEVPCTSKADYRQDVKRGMAGNKFLRYCLVVVLLASALAVVAVPAEAFWVIQTADNSNSGVGEYSSLALDSHNYPHISYYDHGNGHLKYASWSGTAWTTQTADSTNYVGLYTSLALDSGGNPHISYYDQGKSNLNYASWDGTKWIKQPVDGTNANVGLYTSLALDSGGNPHISYYDADNGHLKYAVWAWDFNTWKWEIQTADSSNNVGSYTSLALDSVGDPHISYEDYGSGHLKYAIWDENAWTTQTVDSNNSVGSYTSLALDSHNYSPHISYYDAGNGHLKYASGNGNDWTIQTVDGNSSVGRWTSLVLDSNGYPHISYVDAGNSKLKYASWNGTGWEIQTADSSNNVGWADTSLALDSSGNPHISYYDSFYYFLKYARLRSAGAFPPTPTPTAAPTPMYSGDTGDAGRATAYAASSPGSAPGSTMIFDVNEPLSAGSTDYPYAIISVSLVPLETLSSTKLLVTDAGSAASKPDRRSVVGIVEIEPVAVNPSAISSGTISFAVSGTWLSDHGLAPADIVLMRSLNGVWSELPTTYQYESGGAYYFTATTPGFSYFAVAARSSKAAANTPVTVTKPTSPVATVSEMPSVGVTATTTLVKTTPASASRTPVTTSTTAVPLAGTNTGGSSGIPVLTILAGIGGIAVLAIGAVLGHRWWIHRQNPALFKKYD